MPVLDIGHLLAFPCELLDTGEEGGRELQAGIKGGAVKGVKRRRRDDLTTCSIRKAIFFCAGLMPWTASPGQTQSPPTGRAMPHAAVNSHCDLQVCPVSLSWLMVRFCGGSVEVCSFNSLQSSRHDNIVLKSSWIGKHEGRRTV